MSSFQPIICVPKRTHRVFFSQNSPSLPQNSVSSLLRNSALETVFCPFPIFRSLGTTRISGKTLLERKGQSQSSGRVPGYPHSRNANPILEVVSQTTILGATPERFPELVGTHMKDVNLLLLSQSVFKELRGPHAPEIWGCNSLLTAGSFLLTMAFFYLQLCLGCFLHTA